MIRQSYLWLIDIPLVNLRHPTFTLLFTEVKHHHTSWNCFQGNQSKAFGVRLHHNRVSFMKHLHFLNIQFPETFSLTITRISAEIASIATKQKSSV